MSVQTQGPVKESVTIGAGTVLQEDTHLASPSMR